MRMRLYSSGALAFTPAARHQGAGDTCTYLALSAQSTTVFSTINPRFLVVHCAFLKGGLLINNCIKFHVVFKYFLSAHQ
jgi:hypothetical protein